VIHDGAPEDPTAAVKRGAAGVKSGGAGVKSGGAGVKSGGHDEKSGGAGVKSGGVSVKSPEAPELDSGVLHSRLCRFLTRTLKGALRG